MKWSAAFILCFSVLLLSNVVKEDAPVPTLEDTVVMQTDTSFNMDDAIARINEEIKGKEDLPAEEVFGDIEILKGFPAGRVPMIMKMGFSNSLGVNCTHCHDPEDWSNNDKNEKGIARDMWRLVGTLNSELLSSIPNLKGPQAMVNCTTCHRGDVKPALNLQN